MTRNAISNEGMNEWKPHREDRQESLREGEGEEEFEDMSGGVNLLPVSEKKVEKDMKKSLSHTLQQQQHHAAVF